MTTQPEKTPETFTMQVEVLKKLPVGTDENGGLTYENQRIEKTITLKNLDRYDTAQAGLQSLLVQVCRTFKMKGEAEADTFQVEADPDGLIKLATRYVKELTVISTEFTENDKIDFLRDNLGVIGLGWELMSTTFLPFFYGSKPRPAAVTETSKEASTAS